MNTQELDTLDDAATILADNGYQTEALALRAILAAEAPHGWWSE